MTDPERRRELMRQMRAHAGQCGPPNPIRAILQKTGIFDYEGELDLAIAQGGALPVIELIPDQARSRE